SVGRAMMRKVIWIFSKAR
ncbi:host specificity protein J, partial [Escherichia coli EC1849]